MSHGIVKDQFGRFLDWVYSGNNKSVWHGFATVMEGCKEAKVAARAAGIDWDTLKDRVYRFRTFDPSVLTAIADADLRQHAERLAGVILQNAAQLKAMGVDMNVGNVKEIANWAVTVRSDLDYADPYAELGCVQGSYTPISNMAGFGLMDRVIGRMGAHYETAGSLHAGKQVFISASVPVAMQVMDDTLCPYLMLFTSHDGTSALEVKYVITRPVCENTVMVARAEDTMATVRVVHKKGNVNDDGSLRQHVVDAVRQGIGQKIAAKGDMTEEQKAVIMQQNAMDFLRRQTDRFNALAQQTISADFALNFAQCLIPDPLNARTKHASNKRDDLMGAYFGTQPGEGQQAIRINRETGEGTAYRLYQAATYYNTHMATTKLSKDKVTGAVKTYAEARMDRLIGTGSDFADSALALIEEGVQTNGQSLKDAIDKANDLRKSEQLRALVSN